MMKIREVKKRVVCCERGFMMVFEKLEENLELFSAFLMGNLIGMERNRDVNVLNLRLFFGLRCFCIGFK